MHELRLSTVQLDAVIFAVRSDLETVRSEEGNDESRISEEATLQDALDRLTAARGEK